MKTSLNERQMRRALGLLLPGTQDKSEWYRIRKSVPSPELYMQSDGSWGPWKTAKRFRTQGMAEHFADQNTTHPYGLFNYQN